MLWPISMTTRPDSGRTDDIGDPRQRRGRLLITKLWAPEGCGPRAIRLNNPTPKESDGQAAAQRPDRRDREIFDHRKPTGGEALEVLQYAGIDPEASDDLKAAPAAAISSHRNSCRAEIGDEMLNATRKPGPDHFFHR